MSAATIIQESETATAAVGEVLGSEEIPTHISEVPEGSIISSLLRVYQFTIIL